jgi:hypothetical protein
LYVLSNANVTIKIKSYLDSKTCYFKPTRNDSELGTTYLEKIPERILNYTEVERIIPTDYNFATVYVYPNTLIYRMLKLK